MRRYEIVYFFMFFQVTTHPTTNFDCLSRLFRSIHGSRSYQWNLEDRVRGRTVWYGYTDRAIRSERHYYTTLNYLHYNPVKHQWAKSPYDWNQSSVHWYLEYYGRNGCAILGYNIQ